MRLTWLVIGSTLLSSLAQLMLKQAAMRTPSHRADPVLFIESVLGSPFTWLGLVSFGTSLILWMMVLAQMPVSKAYPFVALGIIITSAAGVLLFGETMSPIRLLSIALISLGVAMLTAS